MLCLRASRLSFFWRCHHFPVSFPSSTNTSRTVHLKMYDPLAKGFTQGDKCPLFPEYLEQSVTAVSSSSLHIRDFSLHAMHCTVPLEKPGNLLEWEEDGGPNFWLHLLHLALRSKGGTPAPQFLPLFCFPSHLSSHFILVFWRIMSPNLSRLALTRRWHTQLISTWLLF